MQNAMCDIFTTKHLFCAPELLPLLPVQSTYLHIHMCTGLLGGGEMGMLVWGELGLAKMKIKGEWLRGGGQSTRTRAPWSPACRLPVAGRFSVDFA